MNVKLFNGKLEKKFNMLHKIKNALISVSDKNQLLKILSLLKKYKVNIISSGGTYKQIKKMGFKCEEVSKYTNFAEMLDGRVKTLHPKIHSGILFDRSKKKHVNQMRSNKFESIDLVIVNFYPFEETLNKTSNKKMIIENIDVGGPSMVRAAAKNHKDVVIITDVEDYPNFVKEIKKFNGRTSFNFREKMASKAFCQTAYYDSLISNWFNSILGDKFPRRKILFGKKIEQLRYGENPHQESSLYLKNFKKDLGLKKISGKSLSYNNYNDIFASLDIIESFKKLPTTVIVKHANPCGVASDKSPFTAFKKSQSSDPISAFGGIVTCNFKINRRLALEINKNFFEVILAKGFEKSAIKIFKQKKNMRIIDFSDFKQNDVLSTKVFSNALLVQDRDIDNLKSNKLKFVTNMKPTNKEIKEIEFAFKVCKFVKSNAIVITNNQATIGIGAGQQNRLDSCKIASNKAKQFQPEKLKNSVAASDAFFPFADGIKTLINSGVKIIVQPGGSIRDREVIEAANKAKIKMVFTGLRHFNH